MATEINPKSIITNKRLNSIETQMFTFLGDKIMPAELVKDAFDGLASQNTINKLAEHSSYLELEDGEINTLDINQVADINYSFSYQGGPDNVNIHLSGILGTYGENQELSDVLLKGFFHSLEVEVYKTGIGNWELTVNQILVTSAAVPYERVVVEEQPITKSGSYDTKKK